MAKPSILLVDDDPISLRILVAHVEGTQYASDTAVSGEQAWEKLLATPDYYQVIVVDRLMGSMSGLDLLRKIKANDDLKDLPVIIQTGQASPEEFIETISAGAYDFVYKPVEQELFLYVLDNSLRGEVV